MDFVFLSHDFKAKNTFVHNNRRSNYRGNSLGVLYATVVVVSTKRWGGCDAHRFVRYLACSPNVSFYFIV